MGGMSSQTKSRAGEDGFWPEDVPERSKGKLLAGLLVVVLLLAAGGVYFFLNRSGDDAAASPGEYRPKSYVPQSAGTDTAKLNLRSADPRPFGEGEIFDSAKNVKYKNYEFQLTATKISECSVAVWGELLLSDLRKGECTQVARGAYLSADKKFAGQFAAFNMVDVNAAQLILTDLEGAGFVRPLEIEGVKEFGKGFTSAFAQVIGHYVIVSWVGRAGGEEPATLNELIDASLAVTTKAEDFAWGRLVLLDPDGSAKQ